MCGSLQFRYRKSLILYKNITDQILKVLLQYPFLALKVHEEIIKISLNVILIGQKVSHSIFKKIFACKNIF